MLELRTRRFDTRESVLKRETRLRRQCHKLFDCKWLGQSDEQKKRDDMYRWLAKKLGISKKTCHFRRFDLATLQRAYAILLEMKDVEAAYDDNGDITFERQSS